MANGSLDQKKVFYGFAWATIVAALLMIGTMTYWMTWPYSGLYNVRQPFPMTSTTVEQGSLGSYTVSYCVDERLPLPITVSRELELQRAGYQLFPLAPPISYVIEKRCETRKLVFGIPTYIPTGTYHIHYLTSLRVNPFREIQQTFVSEDFEIVESTKIKKEAAEAADLVRHDAIKAAKDLRAGKIK